MIRAAYTLLGTALLFVATSIAVAQNDVDAASNEAVRRQALTVELRQKLGEASVAESRKDLAGAAKNYQAAHEKAESVGTGVDKEIKAAAGGIVRVNSELARRAADHGDFKEASTLINSALRVDPKNASLLALKKTNDAAMVAQAGRVPSVAALNEIPGAMSNRVEVATLIQDGKLFLELGKLDEAEAKLKAANELDPLNKVAAYYQSLVIEARFSAKSISREMTEKNQLLAIEEAWQPSVKRDLLPKPNPMANTNLIHTSSGRQAIASKLDRILLNDVKYDGLELSEVVRNLSDEARKRDPDKAGINFLILTESGGAVAAPPGATDPTTGLPLSSVSTETVDLGTIRVKINPPLNNIRLADVLDAIVKTSEKPIKYSIEDYAVVFSLKTPEATPLHTRTFKVDPNTFVQGLEGVGSSFFGAFSSGGGGSGGGGGRGGGGGGSGTATPGSVAAVSASGINFVTRTNHTEGLQTVVKAFFAAAGVDLTAPKAVFFNDRSGVLFVRASLEDLDIIEAAVNTLNVAPPQIHLQAKFAEVTQTDQKALGFQWYLGNTLLGNGNVGVQAGTAPSFTGAPSAANPSQGTFIDGSQITSFPGNLLDRKSVV